MRKPGSASILVAAGLALALSACGGVGNRGGTTETAADTPVTQAIAAAQDMSNQDLYKKAIEESKGKTMYGVGNSSRGATAAESFIAELKKIDPTYDGKIEWTQPKNNSIFTMLDSDIAGSSHQYSMTLIQDGNQIKPKELDTGNLLNFIPKEWKDAAGVKVDTDSNPLVMQTIAKVFMINNLGSGTFDNMWSFVAPGNKPLFMGVDSEPVGKNFLYMLTNAKYATYVKEAFDQLPADQKATFQTTVDAVAGDVDTLGLSGDNAKYALAWIKLFVSQYNEQTDDGPICNELVTTSAAGETGLLVYSKIRSVEESSSASVKNVTIAAYQDGYAGAGGFAYSHYLLVPKTAPLPYTGMAFIAYMTTTTEGFAAWGKDVGSYASNPNINQDHTKDGIKDGQDQFPAKNDKGLAWWTSADGGRLVVEDPAYCAQVSPKMADWIDKIRAGG